MSVKVHLQQVILGGLISEKATLLAEKRNVVSFWVRRDATKVEIKAAVEKMFEVTVADISTLIKKGKMTKFGAVKGKRKDKKKAYVTLTADSKEINFAVEQ